MHGMQQCSSILPLLFLGSTVMAQERPNIVFILADDLGWKDLSCYGNKYTETPNIDSLAKKGMLFTQFYAASPVSSPTRASILTGKYPARLQLTNFLVGNRINPNSPVVPAPWKPYLEAREVTIAELLREAGYTTAMIGKWHLGNHDSIAPWSQGFDFTRMIGKNGLDYYNYSIFEDSYQKEFTDDGSAYLTDKLTDFSIEFLNANREKPFFLYLSYSAPHVGIVPRPDKLMKYFRKYQKAEEKFNPYYAAMVESIDEGVGRIIQFLRDNHLLESTIIIFTSDNGGLGIDELGPTPTSNLPLRMWKGHVYEGGIRVPAIISWQGKIKQAQISNDYFCSIDFFPTICEIAGIDSMPENIDGISILPFLIGKNRSIEQRPLLWHYPHFSNQMGRPAGAVRIGDYKLVENYETGQLELFNLRTDISESVDLSGKMQQRTKDLHEILVKWRKEVGANMVIPNPEYKKRQKP